MYGDYRDGLDERSPRDVIEGHLQDTRLDPERAAGILQLHIHLAQLAGTLARIWALRWAPLRAEYAGPIPYPPNPQQ